VLGGPHILNIFGPLPTNGGKGPVKCANYIGDGYLSWVAVKPVAAIGSALTAYNSVLT
jgi:hypothetical protein